MAVGTREHISKDSAFYRGRAVFVDRGRESILER
jgi:hypothetical protein